MPSAKSCTQGRPQSKYRDEAVVAQILELRKTLTWDQVAARIGLNKHSLQRIVSEETEGDAEVYVPRVLAPWPPVNFKPDNIAARD